MQVDWSLAEAQVTGGGKSTVVSVKTGFVAGQKRKADEATPQINTEKTKKNRRSIGKKAKH